MANDKKRILVTGGNGQLGAALKEVLKEEETLFTDTDNMDITDPAQIEAVFQDFRPDFLIHGAAYTNVDGAEEDPKAAELVNKTGTKNLAAACEKHQVAIIYISTDYVFDGSKNEPYTEEDNPNPMSVYGKTKLAGEEAVKKLPKWWILRTQWLYGEGHNFVRTMLALSEKMTEIKVVADQFGRPTAALDLAKAICDVINKHPESGIYHVGGDGPVISWAEFAEAIFETSGKNTKVAPISTADYLLGKQDQKIAPRPAYSAFDLTKTKNAGIFLNDWKKALKRYLKA